MDAKILNKTQQNKSSNIEKGVLSALCIHGFRLHLWIENIQGKNFQKVPESKTWICTLQQLFT